MLLRLESDNVGVNPKWTAAVLDTSNAHRPFFGEWLWPTLPLKSKPVENRPRAGEQPFRIQNCQIDDALPAAAWNRGAADMFNLQLWFDTLNGTTKQSRNLGGLRVVSAELGRR